MRVLLVHNRYRSGQPSGENQVVEQETDLLRSAGHEVVPYIRSSDEIAGFSAARKAFLPLRVLWSREDRTSLEELIGRTKPDVVHAHNTFPLIGASVVAACRDRRVPLVATLHNFRLMCANGLFLRDARPCEECLGRVPWRAVAHGCYRDSTLASVPLAVGIQAHRSLGTWTGGVTRFLATSEFVRDKYVEGGLPPERVVVKPNFVPRPARRRSGTGSYLLFIGRLSSEKAIDLLVDAWVPEMGKVVVAGDGPLRNELESRARGKGADVEFIGSRSRQECMDLLLEAKALVLPTRAYETFGLVVVEAQAHGVPAVVPRLGVFPGLLPDGRGGQLFSPGDVADLRAKVLQVMSPAASARQGAEAARSYEERFTPEANLAALVGVYQGAMAELATTGGLR